MKTLVLNGSPQIVSGTCYNIPWKAPGHLNYWYADDGHLNSHCAEEGHKIDATRKLVNESYTRM